AHIGAVDVDVDVDLGARCPEFGGAPANLRGRQPVEGSFDGGGRGDLDGVLDGLTVADGGLETHRDRLRDTYRVALTGHQARAGGRVRDHGAERGRVCNRLTVVVSSARLDRVIPVVAQSLGGARLVAIRVELAFDLAAFFVCDRDIVERTVCHIQDDRFPRRRGHCPIFERGVNDGRSGGGFFRCSDRRGVLGISDRARAQPYCGHQGHRDRGKPFRRCALWCGSACEHRFFPHHFSLEFVCVLTGSFHSVFGRPWFAPPTTFQGIVNV